MNEKLNYFSLSMSTIGSAFGFFVGGLDGFLYALAVLTITDYITGVMCAIIEKKLSSEVGAKGIFKKVLIFVLVGIGHVIDAYILGDGSVIRNMVIFFFAANEGISLLENISRIGLPVPPKLKDVLSQLNKEVK